MIKRCNIRKHRVNQWISMITWSRTAASTSTDTSMSLVCILYYNNRNTSAISTKNNVNSRIASIEFINLSCILLNIIQHTCSQQQNKKCFVQYIHFTPKLHLHNERFKEDFFAMCLFNNDLCWKNMSLSTCFPSFSLPA